MIEKVASTTAVEVYIIKELQIERCYEGLMADECVFVLCSGEASHRTPAGHHLGRARTDV
jgi:hypothetical protein